MLSPHTPPGTKVICVNAQDCEGYLREGEAYTVRQMVLGEDVNPASATFGKHIIGVMLEEVVGPPRAGCSCSHFDRRRFRPAVLPQCLTDLLIMEKV